MNAKNITIFVLLFCLLGLYSDVISSYSSSTQLASNAAIYTVNGTYNLNPGISYSCAHGFLNLQYSQFTFVDDGDSLLVQPAMNGLGYMSGSSAINGEIDVAVVNAGGCSEYYTLSGSFNDNNTWQGTFTATFIGSDCSGFGDPCYNQVFNISGTRQGIPEFSGRQFLIGSLISLLVIVPVMVTWLKMKQL